MRHTWVAGFLILGCAFVVQAGAQAAPQPANPQADWQAVQQLPPTTAISVKGQGWRRFRCKVVSADEEMLTCQAERLPGPDFFPPVVYHFQRTEVRQVRLEHPDATAVVASVGVGTLGVVAGATGQGGPNPLASIMLGGLGAMIAGGIAHTFPMHGHVIYRR